MLKNQMPRELQENDKLRKALANKAQFLLDHKNDPEVLRETFKTLPTRLKLLLAPDLYAEDAISELTRQLESARSPKRIRRIVSRIAMWKTALDQMQSIETEEENDNSGQPTDGESTAGSGDGTEDSELQDSGRDQAESESDS